MSGALVDEGIAKLTGCTRHVTIQLYKSTYLRRRITVPAT